MFDFFSNQYTLSTPSKQLFFSSFDHRLCVDLLFGVISKKLFNINLNLIRINFVYVNIFIQKMSHREQYSEASTSSSYSEENERSESRRPPGNHESHRTDFRVLRCFCGCSSLTHEQIEHFVMMNVSTLIVHPVGSSLFRNFLRIGHTMDNSEVMVLMECHELCEKILHNLHLIYDQNSIDDLLNVCPSFTWEQRVTDAIQFDSEQNEITIVTVLQNLMRECVQCIECHNDYDRFRRELLRKIGK